MEIKLTDPTVEAVLDLKLTLIGMGLNREQRQIVLTAVQRVTASIVDEFSDKVVAILTETITA